MQGAADKSAAPCYHVGMSERAPQQFQTPEQEIAYLREQIAQQERELLARNAEVDHADVESIGKHELKEYTTFTPKAVLDKKMQLDEEAIASSVQSAEVSSEPVEEIVSLALEKGIHNALTVVEKLDNAHVTDDVHRRLIELIRSGREVQGLKEGVPPWQLLHMTLFEVVLPEQTDNQSHSLSETFALMEQFLAGMQTVHTDKGTMHYALEIAVADESDDIIFYVAVPNDYINLFEKQILSLFPNASIVEQMHDYNIFVDDGTSLVTEVTLKNHPIYPIRTKEQFEADPLNVLLNAFSKIDRSGGGAAMQVLVRNTPHKYYQQYKEVRQNLEAGMKPGKAIEMTSFYGQAKSVLGEIFSSSTKTSVESEHKEVDQNALELLNKKIESPIFEVNLRFAVSASEAARAEQILTELESTFNQFEFPRSNYFTFKRLKGAANKRGIKAFSFREFRKEELLPLSHTELATMFHFPAQGIQSSPQFKQSRAKTAPAPNDMPTEGTLLGSNIHRNVERDIYVTELDRMRHFYVIGQTGTGKTTLMKNMIVQDIQAGHGVCMIDPHGTDIADVMSAIPPEREQDLIYFDPANMNDVVGLNMLEYDERKPEQKTFVVNELFSIFQKLYSATPEAMGPMFEQYFRNATMLVLEDPESGNTLMDISRVMSDARYRRQKLEKATNPVVTQFWRQIATQAGGEASLENIVPYIVSKFDVFTANDYMRPIIGQQHSSFDFRRVMDERKILLVNLSKGRLGEINANLIGMILVGKILMAALSRVDDPTGNFPPFYLHMDEFQNVSTNSISAILSEARKYKLGLTIAHQFIAQLDPDIKDAVFGNVGSMTAFRVGPEDAQFLEHQFAPTFTASDLMNVPNHTAYARLLANGTPTRAFSLATRKPPETDHSKVERLIAESNARHTRPRAEVEREINERYQKKEPSIPSLGV